MIQSSSEVRDVLVKEFKNYLLGPYWGKEEIVDFNPRFFYMLGILYPGGSEPEQDNLDVQIEDEKEDTHTDKAIMDSLLPSSFGLTFLLDSSAKEFQIRLEYGVYESVKHKSDEKKTLYRRKNYIYKECCIKTNKNRFKSS